MFYEPDCNSCKTIIENMKNMPELNELIDNKKLLKILAVYAIGNEDIWKDYFPQMPANWINGIDKNQFIINRNLYDLKASPTMYLLDKSKHVILKDSDLGHVLYFLTTNKQFN
ncbi:thioredoxin-like domain-containing protein [Sphingobacterium spiritivorum]|nr:thioredoxin family protein [Sphingobacterium spiritivorum]